MLYMFMFGVCNSLQIRHYPANYRIFSEGDEGDEFYIIGIGEVDITALDEDRNDQFLCSKKKGDFFGEHAVNTTTGKHTRTATVTSTAECDLLVIHRDAYIQYLRKVGENMKGTMKNIMGERMVTTLK